MFAPIVAVKTPAATTPANVILAPQVGQALAVAAEIAVVVLAVNELPFCCIL